MIQVMYNNVLKKQHNFWNHIHFHPTDAIEDDWGREILDNVAKDGVAQTVRMYAMLEDIVSMDENGNLQYDFTECDVRIDYLLSKGFQILLSYNFIPKCIAIDPNEGTTMAKNKEKRYKGKTICSSPPKDYGLWEEVCYQLTRHLVDRYGLETVSQWYLQCFNEPDIGAFFMKYETNDSVRVGEYLKLYRGFQSGCRRVSEQLKIGGPALANNPVFLIDFLKTVISEELKLDFFCAHNYGTSPKALGEGTRDLHILNNMRRIDNLTHTLNCLFGKDKMEVIMDEWGATTLGFWNKEECPALLFREDSRFAVYFGKLITACVRANINLSKMLICLSGQHEMVTDFSGFRGFFTLNGFRKPIYNAYVLAAKLRENILESHNDIPGLEVLASKDEAGKMAIMLNYASEYYDKPMPSVQDKLQIEGLTGKRSVTVWCIDEVHTNPYTRMLREKMQEEALSEADIQVLRQEGQMKPVAIHDITADGSAVIDVSFTNNAMVLVEIL